MYAGIATVNATENAPATESAPGNDDGADAPKSARVKAAADDAIVDHGCDMAAEPTDEEIEAEIRELEEANEWRKRAIEEVEKGKALQEARVKRQRLTPKSRPAKPDQSTAYTHSTGVVKAILNCLLLLATNPQPSSRASEGQGNKLKCSGWANVVD